MGSTGSSLRLGGSVWARPLPQLLAVCRRSVALLDVYMHTSVSAFIFTWHVHICVQVSLVRKDTVMVEWGPPFSVMTSF